MSCCLLLQLSGVVQTSGRFFCRSPRFLTQYKGVYERDVKCQVKMSRNSGSVGQGPPSPTKDEVTPRTTVKAGWGDASCRPALLFWERGFEGSFNNAQINLPLFSYLPPTGLSNCSLPNLQGDGISPLVQTSVLGKGVKHRPPPIKMPSGPGSSSSGTGDPHQE